MTKDSIKNNIEGVKTANIYNNYQKLRENGTLRKNNSRRKSIVLDESKQAILNLIKNDDTYKPAEISKI